VDVGRADEAEWGSRHFWDDYDITETFLQLGVDGTFGVDVRILEKSIEEKTGLYPHTLIL
ncbi:MAG: hypothetical protein JW839_21485, partial [Candidatus Lokiarchaeota archaeon]|nr:hypothetical protein [Candidatus Lokiarchaeota archaeon]